MKKAIYPGSFDPFHKGHMSIYKKAIKLFDEVIIYVANNDDKIHQETIDKRKGNIEKMIPGCKVIADNKLTTLIANENDAIYIIRGLRSFQEVEYELLLASVNKKLNRNIETVIIFADDELKNVSSTRIRNIQNKYTTNIEQMVKNK